jgi:hypothetical protein
MPTWLKILLLILLVLAVLLGIGVFFGIRWVQSKGGRLRDEGQQVMAEAREFGRGKEANACMSEAFVRLRACDGFICEAKVNVFLKTCLEAAEVPPGFCEGVPRRDEIMAAARWTIDQCSQRGMAGDQPCNRLMRAVQEYCHPRGGDGSVTSRTAR